MSNFNKLDLPNNGIIICDLPVPLFSEIKNEVTLYIKNKLAVKLQKITTVGHIETAFKYALTSQFKSFLKEAYNHYVIAYNKSYVYNNIDYDDAWINLQKKYEYQPNHQHIGHYSWVLWVNIPYDLNEEDCYHTGNNKDVKCNGRFEIVYSDIIGNHNTYKINLDKTYEGKLILFPAKLRHSVYPFYTSDDYRISVAGNLIIK